MVSSIAAFGAVIQDLGLNRAAIQRERISAAQISALFWLSAGFSFVLALAGQTLVQPRMAPRKKLLADKAYDCAAFRDWLSRRGTTPVIPNKINRRKPYPHNK
jgi:hypothetical protein